MSAFLRRLLVATDGSDTGQRVLDFAIGTARRHGSELILCYAVDHAGAIAECSASTSGFDGSMSLVQALDEAAASILRDAAQRVRGAGLESTSLALDGRSAQAIVACALERGVDAIVMGTQGKRGLERMFLGSTADGVLRRTDIPTFVVPPGTGDASPAFARIVVALDDSDPSDAAATFAIGLAAADAAQLVLCSVVETARLFENAATYGYDPAPMLEEMRAAASGVLAPHAERARAQNVACESIVVEGNAAERIMHEAHERHADLIVVGTHGRRGLHRLFVGSVAESIVRRSSVPVVVLRATTHRVLPPAPGERVTAGIR